MRIFATFSSLLFLSCGLIISACNVSETTRNNSLFKFKFQNVDGPVVKVILDQNLDTQALIDTGLSMCILRPELAKTFSDDLDRRPSFDIAGFGDEERLKYVGTISIKVQDSPYQRQQTCYAPAKSEGVSALDHLFQTTELDLLIGLDYFKGTEFVLDGINSTIEISRIDPEISDIETVKLGVAPVLENLYHNVEVENAQYSVFLDSGFLFEPYLVFLNSATERIQNSKPDHPFDTVSFPEFSKSKLRRGIFDVRFNTEPETSRQDTLIVYDGIYVQSDKDNGYKSDGFLGWEIMEAGVSKFNLIGEPNTWSSDFQLLKELPLKYNLTGIGSVKITEQGYYEILSFQPISPAKDSGLKIGDKILALNGIAVNSIDFTNTLRRDIFWGEYGLSIPVKFIREGDPMIINMELRFYLTP